MRYDDLGYTQTGGADVASSGLQAYPSYAGDLPVYNTRTCVCMCAQNSKTE